MLPDQLRILISAYASDDLSPRSRSAASRLLRHSQDARDLLRNLRNDTRRLQQLPKPTLPPDFATSIIDRLAPGPIIIRPPSANTKRWPSLVGSLAAVCTTAAVCVGIWLVGFGSKSNSNVDPSIARNTVRVVEIAPASDATTPVKKIESTTAESLAIARAEPSNCAASTPNVATPATDKSAALASPPLTAPNLETVIVPRIAEFFAPQALDQKVIRDSLTSELVRHDVDRIDLFVGIAIGASSASRAAFENGECN